MFIIGTFFTIVSLVALTALYHAFMQEHYDDITHQEYEERYDRDLEYRWRNQDIRIRQQFVIVDEMKGGVCK